MVTVGQDVPYKVCCVQSLARFRTVLANILILHYRKKLRVGLHQLLLILTVNPGLCHDIIQHGYSLDFLPVFCRRVLYAVKGVLACLVILIQELQVGIAYFPIGIIVIFRHILHKTGDLLQECFWCLDVIFPIDGRSANRQAMWVIQQIFVRAVICFCRNCSCVPLFLCFVRRKQVFEE